MPLEGRRSPFSSLPLLRPFFPPPPRGLVVPPPVRVRRPRLVGGAAPVSAQVRRRVRVLHPGDSPVGQGGPHVTQDGAAADLLADVLSKI